MTLEITMPHDNTKIDFDSLPETSRLALVNRGLTHVFGNEVASQVVQKIRSEIAGENRKTESVTTDEVKRYRAENGKAIDEWLAKLQADKATAITEGKLGVRAPGSGGVVRDPLQREMRRIAVAQVTEQLKKHGFKMPSGDDVITMNAGKANEYTLSREQLIERRLKAHGEAIERLAKRAIAAKQAEAKVGDESLEDALGLAAE